MFKKEFLKYTSPHPGPTPQTNKSKKNKMDVSKNRVPPPIIHFNRVFHYFHYPFWAIGVASLLETPIYVRLEILDVMSLKKHLQAVEQCPEALKISNFAGPFRMDGWMDGWVELSRFLSWGVVERKSWIIQECE